MKRIPNFFLVGAPKAGTSALATFLREHPQIFLTDPKEPEYFAFDIPRVDERPYHRSLEGYLDLYSDVTRQHLAVGEGSTTYLFSKEAIKEIASFNRSARIVVILRNPIDLVHSFHQHMVFDEWEDVVDFREAWALQNARSNGRCIPANSRRVLHLQYAEVGQLGRQLERVFRFFPEEQVLVHTYDDFQCSNRRIYLKTLHFLGVPDDGRVTFPRHNHQLGHRYPVLAKARRALPVTVQKSIRKALKSADRLSGSSFVTRFNTTRVDRAPLSKQFRAELAEFFYHDVKKLSLLTGRDLTKWLEISS